MFLIEYSTKRGDFMDVFNELLENIKIERENEKQCSKPYKCGNKIT